MKDSEILNISFIPMDSYGGKKKTIKEYLIYLLETLWVEKEGFSGKRPFGNSGWEYDLYKPLIENNKVVGSLDEYGYVNFIK